MPIRLTEDKIFAYGELNDRSSESDLLHGMTIIMVFKPRGRVVSCPNYCFLSWDLKLSSEPAVTMSFPRWFQSTTVLTKKELVYTFVPLRGITHALEGMGGTSPSAILNRRASLSSFLLCCSSGSFRSLSMFVILPGDLDL